MRYAVATNGNIGWIANYIWGIAADVLRDLYVRGKYRDIILPMTVLRRLDAVPEDTKQAVLDMKASLDKAGVVEQKEALRQASGQAFCKRPGNGVIAERGGRRRGVKFRRGRWV